MIRSELDVLLEKVQDEALRADLRKQIDRLKERRSYGLVFERHIPERVRLPQREVRIGARVVSRDGDDNATWEVLGIEGGVVTLSAVRDAEGSYVQRGEHGATEHAPIDSLVVISEFGEPVLPGLRHLGSVERGGDKPYHVVIKGENYHALEALRFTHAGKIDCIYVDPPYNSGARDWKYNNDYVDDNDAYRHSKWLAFMERRLKLAKELLNPADAVLIVTIDEREHARLHLLLEQTFGSGGTQMATIVVNPAGTGRENEFSRTNEFAYIRLLGAAKLEAGPDNMFDRDLSAQRSPIDWRNLRRRERSSHRLSRPNQFYPIFVHEAGGIASVGDPLPGSADRTATIAPKGTRALFPLSPSGQEMTWSVVPARLRFLVEHGYARSDGLSVQFLNEGTVDAIEAGVIEVSGRDDQGGVIATFLEGGKRLMPKSVWNRERHNAQAHGTVMLSRLIPGRHFPYPKSLYAVEDTIRFFVKDKPNAVVLDFFAGSGTTAHAVMRLNRQDGGRRQSIMVTNNEVSVDEAADLRKRGLRPGDPEWEAQGIFEHITRPRVEAAVTGKTPDGEPIKGEYKFTDQHPMADGFEENVNFLELTYLDADNVDLGLGFDDLAALIWLRAGAEGPIARATDAKGKSVPFVWTDRYGVIFDTDQWRDFVSKRPQTGQAAFVVTYSPAVFASIAAELPTGMDVVRLYDSYLARLLAPRVSD